MNWFHEIVHDQSLSMKDGGVTCAGWASGSPANPHANQGNLTFIFLHTYHHFTFNNPQQLRPIIENFNNNASHTSEICCPNPTNPRLWAPLQSHQTLSSACLNREKSVTIVFTCTARSEGYIRNVFPGFTEISFRRRTRAGKAPYTNKSSR